MNQQQTTLKLKNEEPIPEYYTGIVERENGTKEWRKKGMIHREDGPAVEYSDGTKCWYKNGLWHRLDGPAVEYQNKYKNRWHIDGNIMSAKILKHHIDNMIYLGTEKGKYNLYWLKFLSENGVEEFPIIPGMEKDENFKPLLLKTLGT